MGKIERRLFLQGMSVSVAGGLTAWVHQALAAEPNALRQGIHQIKGEVAVNGVRSKEGAVIKRGDVVSTGAGAHAVFVLGDNAFLQRADSRVAFGTSSAATFLRVVTGGLLSVFGKGRRQLTTPVATIGIRGTGCYIETDARKSYFCLCFGAVDLQLRNGQPQSYSTTHHEKPVMIENGAATPTMVMNHTDAEIIMLEALVGRGSPFPADGAKY
jgi:FecR protein